MLIKVPCSSLARILCRLTKLAENPRGFFSVFAPFIKGGYFLTLLRGTYLLQNLPIAFHQFIVADFIQHCFLHTSLKQ